MSLNQLRNCNLGRNRANATGSTGVGYTILDEVGGIVLPRTTSGVYQIMSGSGLYAAYIGFPDNFRGQVVWDTGTAFLTASYAIEQYNVEENEPKVAETWQMVNEMTGSVQGLFDVAFGRWRLDPITNQMVIYRDDNSTVVATFNLLDNNGTPTYDCVFERQLVGTVVP